MASPFDDVASLLATTGQNLPQQQGGLMGGFGDFLAALPQGYADMLGQYGQAFGGQPPAQPQTWKMPPAAPDIQPHPLAPLPQAPQMMQPAGPAAPGFRFGAMR